MPDPWFDAYDRVRRRIGALVMSPGVDASLAVPACPGWSLHAVVAHLAGLADDVIAENTDHYAEPDWTAAQVTRHGDTPLPLLLDAWDVASPRLRQVPLPDVGRAFKSVGRLVFVDASVHEHDLRGALGTPDPDDEAVLLSLDSSLELLGRVLRRPSELGTVPSLRVTVPGIRSWTFGDAADPVTVTGAPFELWRGLTGRRTPAQVSELRWSADPAPFFPHWAFGPLSFPEFPLEY
jgi:uncharacterized protein (TIGR03083 family)